MTPFRRVTRNHIFLPGIDLSDIKKCVVCSGLKLSPVGSVSLCLSVSLSLSLRPPCIQQPYLSHSRGPLPLAPLPFTIPSTPTPCAPAFHAPRAPAPCAPAFHNPKGPCPLRPCLSHTRGPLPLAPQTSKLLLLDPSLHLAPLTLTLILLATLPLALRLSDAFYSACFGQYSGPLLALST